jgi:ribosomal protein S18 acetylase RimI-like enzyme
MNRLIRDAQSTDSVALTALVVEVQALHVGRRPDAFRPVPDPEIATWLSQAFQNPAIKIWVAETAGAVSGYLLSVVRKQAGNPFVIDRTWLELDQICVHPAQRGVGVARALVETARAYAKAQCIRDVELCAWSFNEEAQRAFAQLGFVPKVVRFELSRP